MSLFGKILAVLNILAAAAFGYFMMQASSQRAKWAYAAYRYELALTGLPADKTEKNDNKDLEYELITEDLRKALQIDVQTQEEFADNAVNQAKTMIQSAGQGGKPIEQQIQIMLFLSEDAEERKPWLELLNYVKTDANIRPNDPDLEKAKESLPKELETRLTHYRALDQQAKKIEIANLSVSLLELFAQQQGPQVSPFQTPFYAKMVKVVGLPAASKALSRKAQILGEITNHYAKHIRPLVHTYFVIRHDDLVRQIREQERLYRDMLAKVTEKTDQFTEAERRAKAQLAKVETKRQELAAEQKKSNDLLLKLAKEQKRLFDTLRELRDVNAENQTLVEDIKRLENDLR